MLMLCMLFSLACMLFMYYLACMLFSSFCAMLSLIIYKPSHISLTKASLLVIGENYSTHIKKLIFDSLYKNKQLYLPM